jgi:hypothetical protein
MENIYTARAYRIPGRQKFSITFRHPGMIENGRPGRKVSKGLGTADEEIAKHLEGQMNNLLARTDLHSLAGRGSAASLFDERVVEIFYSHWEPAITSHRATRDRLLPIPKDTSSTLLLGITGAGKTTLLRRLIGTADRFPAVSVNRTTTCEIEVITGSVDYTAVVTFLTRHQAEQQVIECFSNAVLKAIEGSTDEAVATEFLEPSGQRFRLKYVLGPWKERLEYEADPFSFNESIGETKSEFPAEESKFLTATVQRLKAVALASRKEVESILGPFETLKGDERDYALDEAQRAAEQSEDFLQLVSDVMEEIAERFDSDYGNFIRSSTGWPESWKLSVPSNKRENFLAALQRFCGISREHWGNLLTPLVTGIRISGPFRPHWVPEHETYTHVFIDTEGLLHARTTTEVPSDLTSRFKDVDSILLVESAKTALHSPTSGKVFEAIASSGYTSKFAVLFTNMDAVTGDNLTSPASKRAHIFGGVRSVLDAQVARNVSRESARQLAAHLQENTFYFAYLDPKGYPASDAANVEKFEALTGAALWQMIDQLECLQEPVLQRAFPRYSFEALGLAVQEVSLRFLAIYDARLGYKPLETITEAPWQSIKAMSRRYAEGWLFDGFWLNPIDTLIAVTRNVLTRFLEIPLNWEGKRVSDEEKSAVIEAIKRTVNELLTDISRSRLWRVPQSRWKDAYELRGAGSTDTRRGLIRHLFQAQIPVPESVSNRAAQAWVEEIKELVIKAVEKVKVQQENTVTKGSQPKR